MEQDGKSVIPPDASARAPRTYSYALQNGDHVQVAALSDGHFRLRYRPDSRFVPSSMERYGIVKREWPPVHISVTEQADTVSFKTAAAELSVDLSSGAVVLSQNGATLIGDLRPFPTRDGKGIGATVGLHDGERFYGSGYRKTDYIELRGHSLRNHVAYGDCYGPNPFLMSSGRWGLYFNTTYDSYFDIGSSDPDQLMLWSAKGELDLYVMTGDYRELLFKFTELTGRPTLLPRWGYGLMFIANEKETQFDILNDARTFRQEGIPCDTIGLEPGWMSKHYDLSIEKDWDREKFYMPWWNEDRRMFRDVNFIGALGRNGFKTSLWLACDYDVFEEEERTARLAGYEPEAEAAAPVIPEAFGKIDFDPRAHADIYMDKLTKPGVPWFDHLKKFIDSGVRAFKQDPAYVVNDHPDRLYANGMRDDEAHNLISTVLAKQVHEGYRAYTGERPFHFMGTAYTGVQRWGPTWTCDCGGREEALLGILQHSLCGHMNVSCDMDVHTIEGIHFGSLLPWSLVCSWAYIDHPWWLGDRLYRAFKAYAKLHYRLIPYLYSYAHTGYRTGMPIVRAMPLQYPEDPQAARLNRQYMLGDYLLVGAFADRVYLPEGRWIDYWTGETQAGGSFIQYTPPADKGGALFVKEGAILVMAAEDSPHVPEKPAEAFCVHYYPADGESEFTLFEDDGIGFGYERGEVAETRIRCARENGIVTVKVSVSGYYAGMAERIKLSFILHGDRPKQVICNDAIVDESEYTSESDGETIRWSMEIIRTARLI